MERIFLHWSEPCLPAIAASLIARAREAHSGWEIDLSDTLCVLSGGRPGRLLLEALTAQARQAERPLIPPRIITPGALGDVLLEPDQPRATPTEQQLAWMQAAERATAETLRALRVPAADPADRVALARLLAQLADALAGGQRTFGDVQRLLADRGLDHESQRWAALVSLEADWLRILADLGLSEPMRAERHGTIRAAAREQYAAIALICVPELNMRQRHALQPLRDRIVTYVHAPEELADTFDDLGCVRTEQWAERSIDLDRAHIHIADRTFDVAQQALRQIEDAPSHAWVVGLGDESMQPTFTRCGAWAGRSLHPAAGEPLAQTAPFMLLSRVLVYLQDPRFAHLAALLRVPDVEAWLRRQLAPADHNNEDVEELRKGVSRWLGLLEAYFTDHLQGRITNEWLGDEKQQDALKRIYAGITSLLAPFDDTPRPLRAWCDRIRVLLTDVFGHLLADDTDRAHTIHACIALHDHLTTLAATDTRLQPELSATDALAFLLAEAEAAAVPVVRGADDLDLLGFLELHLDPATHLVIAGVNDGAIPRQQLGDPFLPDSIRQALGLANNRTRAARDGYLLQATINARSCAHLIVGRRGINDEPLNPSRFLFHTDAETILARVRDFCGAGEHAAAGEALGVPAGPAESGFVIPPIPDGFEPPTSMSITEFSTYLACPYRWALRRVLKLKDVEPPGDEMSPLHFGNLAHLALEHFGKDESLRALDDPDHIAGFLEAELDRLAALAFSCDNRLPAVHVQLAHLGQRLRDFARRQARWREEGWEIRHAEFAFGDDDGLTLDIPGDEPMLLRGKIDRVDYNPRTKRWRIIDYKTGERARSPFMAHHGRDTIPDDAANRWRDLQLPLYWYLLTQAGRIDPDLVELGYIVLPQETGGTAFKQAKWSRELLEEAVETARTVVRNIRSRAFMMEQNYTGFSMYPRICQTTVLGTGTVEWEDAAV